MSKKVKVNWTCPHCGYEHKWKWKSKGLIPYDEVWMACGECGYEFKSGVTNKGIVQFYRDLNDEVIKQLTNVKGTYYEC